MRRVIKYAALGFGALIIIALAAVFVLPKTGPGRALIDNIARPIVKDAVKTALGSEIEFDPIAGALPGELILSNVSMSDDEGVWVSIERLHLEWDPLALIRGAIVVDDFTVTDAILFRQPTLPERPAEEEDEEDDEGGDFSLPNIRVANVLIDEISIREPVLGERYDLRFRADLEAQGRRIQSRARLDAEEDQDLVRAVIDLNRDDLTLNIEALSAPNGMISSLAKAGDAIWISLNGSGPLADWSGDLDASLGDYGALGGAVSGNLKTLDQTQFALTIAPGPLIPEDARAAMGERVEIAAAGRIDDNDIVNLSINSLKGRFGEIVADFNLNQQATDITANVRGDLSADLLEQYGAADFAGPLTLTANAQQSDEGAWAFSGELNTDTANLVLEEGRSRETTPFQGRIALTAPRIPLADTPIDDVLAQGGDLSANVTLTAENQLSVRDALINLGKDQNIALRVSGAADYGLESGVIDADLSMRVGRGLPPRFVEGLNLAAPVTATVKASGTTEDAKLTLSAAIPRGEYDETIFTPGTLSADLTGLPTRPSGTVRITSTNGSYRALVDLTTTEESYRLTRLDARLAGIEATASGNFSPASGAAQLNAEITATENAIAIGGAPPRGTLSVDVSRGSETAPLSARIISEDIAVAGSEVKGLQVLANGPPDAIDVAIQFEDAYVADTYLIGFNAAAQVDTAAEAPEVLLSTLNVGVGSTQPSDQITLLAPTTVTIGETIRVTQMDLDWLDEGRVSVSGSYVPSRWQADADLSAIPLRGVEVPLTAQVRLDTNESTPATFELSARAQDEDGNAATLAVDGAWNGRELQSNARITEDTNGEFANARLTLPLRLTRDAGTLGVELPETPMDGLVRLNGDLAQLSPFIEDIPILLRGAIEGNVAIRGTPTAPALDGTITLREGRVEDEEVGFTLTNLSADAEFGLTPTGAQGTLRLTGSGVDERPNAVSLNGTFNLNEGASEIDTRFVLDRARLIRSPELNLTASSDIAITGSLEDLLVAGQATVNEAEYIIPSEVPASGAPTFVPVDIVRTDGQLPEAGEIEAAEEREPSRIRLDLAIRADNRVFVRGRGLNSEWSVDLTVAGTANAPILGGSISNREGTFDFAGRTFDITDGRIAFSRTSAEIDPRIDLTAAYEATEVTAFVTVAGPASDPQISLSSNPNRPDEDIMALVLFGKQPTELSALESVQIASAIAQLTGTSPFGGGGGGGIRSTLGLDALSFGVDSETGAGQVEVGKYISDNVYVSAKQSAQEAGTEVTITYEVSDTVTVESTLKANGAQNVSANYKRDY